ncbi:MAG: hypothetical protein K2X55_12195 [Burkholderiaceae bacterium]|nr:hypothetical protein [Burkholderiaceae bacterium]
MNSYHFNNRANGIFAEGFRDRDGTPVGDTFVWRLRAKMVGAAGRNWSSSQNAELAASLSSAEMNAIMSDVDHPHVCVEYDMNFYGGNYSSIGKHVYVPEALVDLVDGNVAAAFSKFTRIDAVHMVSYVGDQRFGGDGDPLEEIEYATESFA